MPPVFFAFLMRAPRILVGTPARVDAHYYECTRSRQDV